MKKEIIETNVLEAVKVDGSSYGNIPIEIEKLKNFIDNAILEGATHVRFYSHVYDGDGYIDIQPEKHTEESDEDFQKRQEANKLKEENRLKAEEEKERQEYERLKYKYE